MFLSLVTFSNQPLVQHCVGHFDEPQCVQVCPVACIPVNPQHIESRETLWQKYQRLTAAAAPVATPAAGIK